jgi:hypothetical protein
MRLLDRFRPRLDDRRGGWHGDASLSTLLVVQGLTLFVALPLGAGHPVGRVFLDASHLAFAAVCAVALTHRRVVRGALLVGLALLAAVPVIAERFGARFGVGVAGRDEAIALVAFAFNALVTSLVVRRVFGPGRVTAYRVQGAVLVYLNVAALFAIAYAVLEAHAPGAIVPTAGGTLGTGPGLRTSTLSYFSLATITTTGFGELVPVHPLARSLANLEAVFGQLFPATFVARLVALQLVHDRRGNRDGPDARPDA